MRTHAKTATRTHKRPASAAVEFYRQKLEFEIGPYTLKEILDLTPAKIFLIDVRGAEAFAEAHIPGAVNIPLADLQDRLGEMSTNKTLVTYCGDITCQLSSRAALVLAEAGLKVQHLVGGIAEWSRKGFPVESAQSEEPTRQPDRPVKPEESEEEEKKKEEGEGGPME